MLLPGPEAQQLATYIGWLMHRTLGGIVSGGLFVLPSLLILIVQSRIYVAFGSLPLVAGILYGIKPAVTAIVLFAAYRIGSRALKNALLLTIAVAAFVAIFLFQVPFPWIILGAGIVGAIGVCMRPALFVSGGHQGPWGNSDRRSSTTTPRRRNTRALPGHDCFVCCWSVSDFGLWRWYS